MAKAPAKETDQRLKAFFRNTILTEPGMAGELADQLADRCVQSIENVLTRRGVTSLAQLPAAVEDPAAPSLLPQFDPFAFSAVSVLARKGHDALLARLGEIGSADHLREFANAQHIPIDQTLTRAEELRAAILKGTERRIAARRAAAS